VLTGFTAGDAVGLMDGALVFVLVLTDAFVASFVGLTWLSPLSGDLVASALGLTVEGATSLPGLEGATDGESFTSPSSSSSSELCTSSADLIFDESLHHSRSWT
jgi:hypothetical protein